MRDNRRCYVCHVTPATYVRVDPALSYHLCGAHRAFKPNQEGVALLAEWLERLLASLPLLPLAQALHARHAIENDGEPQWTWDRMPIDAQAGYSRMALAVVDALRVEIAREQKSAYNDPEARR